MHLHLISLLYFYFILVLTVFLMLYQYCTIYSHVSTATELHLQIHKVVMYCTFFPKLMYLSYNLVLTNALGLLNGFFYYYLLSLFYIL